MAVLWNLSLTPRHDPSDAPYVGALAYFFDVGTTTPQIVYTDSSLSIPHDHPVEADGNGVFPAVFLADQSSHRIRITTAEGVTLHDVDGISVPITTPAEIPDSDTPVDQRFQTGDIKIRWATSAQTGWVRVNGRTIGAAASGATERANADCENLFVFLWNNDATLAVSGGRGGTANGDWAANKTIALPDPRGRALVILDSFGNSAANRVTDAVLGADSDALGAAGGASTHTLTSGQIPSHTHTGTTDAGGNHGHPYRSGTASPNQANGSGGFVRDASNATTYTAFTGTVSGNNGEQIGASGTHTHAFTTGSAGSGEAHNNLQPSIMIPLFIKL